MTSLINILLIAVIIGMVTNAINIITSPGMLFGFINEIMDVQYHHLRLHFEQNKADRFLFYMKPFFTCPPCMSSVWGSLTYWAIIEIINPFSGDELTAVVFWPITILVGSFTSYLFAKFNHNV